MKGKDILFGLTDVGNDLIEKAEYGQFPSDTKSCGEKESHRKANNKYNNQLCSYNNEILTLSALTMRFRRAGIKHPNIEANKYILKKESNNAIEFYDVYP